MHADYSYVSRDGSVLLLLNELARLCDLMFGDDEARPPIEIDRLPLPVPLELRGGRPRSYEVAALPLARVLRRRGQHPWKETLMLRAIASLALVAGCVAGPLPDPETAAATQAMRCLTCGDDGAGVTYQQAVNVSSSWVSSSFSGSQRVSFGCDTVEIGGAVGYSCWVAFDWFGTRYTAQCTVWDNTSAGGAEGHNACDIE